ncbi:hypothetical protein LLH00_12685 [bacterium]|nr:hypothetical protein [bacterium]
MHSTRTDLKYALAFLLLLTAGCVNAQFNPAPGAPSYPATRNVMVLKGIPEKPYIELGEITARGQDEHRMLERIRKQAMEVGAEAIILTPTQTRTSGIKEQHQGQFATTEVLMRAIAIRFKAN